MHFEDNMEWRMHAAGIAVGATAWGWRRTMRSMRVRVCVCGADRWFASFGVPVSCCYLVPCNSIFKFSYYRLSERSITAIHPIFEREMYAKVFAQFFDVNFFSIFVLICGTRSFAPSVIFRLCVFVVSLGVSHVCADWQNWLGRFSLICIFSVCGQFWIVFRRIDLNI